MKNRNCRHCWWKLVNDEKKIAVWLADVMGARLKYQWLIRDELGREEAAFRYMHPREHQRWLEEGPCVGCPCERHCDRVCSLRARWWDDRMAQVRKRMGK